MHRECSVCHGSYYPWSPWKYVCLIVELDYLFVRSVTVVSAFCSRARGERGEWGDTHMNYGLGPHPGGPILEEFRSWREIIRRVPEEGGGCRGKGGGAGNCSRPPWGYHKGGTIKEGS